MWNAQKWQFFAGPRSWKSSIFSTFWKASLKWWKSPQLTTGHLKCKYLTIWMRNMQKCEMPKNDNFSQVRGHENLQFFRLSGKPLKMMEITPSWPQDTWNVNILTIWMRNMQKCEMPKNDNFSQVRGHENLQFFRLSGKPLKMMEITPSWPQNTWNVNILTIWMRNMQKCEMPKNDNFSQVRGHENIQFFRLSGKPLKMMEIIPSWPQDTWNVNIWPFGWEICKNVKCPKMTIFRRSAVMKIFNFLDFLESLLKWWKSPPVDHRTLEM